MYTALDEYSDNIVYEETVPVMAAADSEEPKKRGRKPRNQIL